MAKIAPRPKARIGSSIRQSWRPRRCKSGSPPRSPHRHRSDCGRRNDFCRPPPAGSLGAGQARRRNPAPPPGPSRHRLHRNRRSRSAHMRSRQRCRKRSGMVERPAMRHNPGAAHAAESRLQPDRAAKARGDADRAARIRSHRHRHDARGYRCAGAATGSAGTRDRSQGFFVGGVTLPRRIHASASCR